MSKQLRDKNDLLVDMVREDTLHVSFMNFITKVEEDKLRNLPKLQGLKKIQVKALEVEFELYNSKRHKLGLYALPKVYSKTLHSLENM